MTDAEILALSLDELEQEIGRKIFGLEVYGGMYVEHSPVDHGRPLPKSARDIAAAWQVVEKMEARGYWCQTRTSFGPIGSQNYDGYWAGFTPHWTTGWNGRPDHWTNAETLPLAICRAALMTVGE